VPEYPSPQDTACIRPQTWIVCCIFELSFPICTTYFTVPPSLPSCSRSLSQVVLSAHQILDQQPLPYLQPPLRMLSLAPPTNTACRRSKALEHGQLVLFDISNGLNSTLCGGLPKLLWFPSLFPRSPALASKEERLFNPVTTVALVTASSAAAPYKPPCVCTRPSIMNAIVQLTTPICTTLSGCMRRTTDPCSSEATRPMKPRSLPESFA
jgi:hypothetical protein